MRGIIPSIVLLLCLSFMIACGGKKENAEQQHRLPDTLNVGTLYSPTGFFILKGDTMGYDYDRVCDFARSYGIALRFKVARSMSELLKMLDKLLTQELEVPVYVSDTAFSNVVEGCARALENPDALRRPYTQK